MSYANIFITGASRGIGLGLAKHYAALPSTSKVFATYRTENTALGLKELADRNGKINLLELDLRDYKKYNETKEAVARELGPAGLNLLINNAGIHIPGDFHDTTREAMLEVFEVNVVVPLMMTQALAPLLILSGKTGKKTFVANISSRIGSISDNTDRTTRQFYPYRISKAALNQLSKSMTFQLGPDNIIVASVHPGWVRTDICGHTGPLDVDTSVKHITSVFEKVTPDQAGLLLSYDGTVLSY